LVLLSAGSASRFVKDFPVKKQWIYIDDKPLWLFVAKRFQTFYDFEKIVIVSSKEEINYMKNFSSEFEYVVGGDSRQESLKNSLEKVETPYVLVSDVARACVTKEMIDEIISQYNKAECIVPTLSVPDTVIYDKETIDREKVKLIQTPQLSKTDILKEALNQKELFTDDSSAIKSLGGTIFYTKGNTFAKKITYIADLKELSCLKPPKEQFFVGTGYDVHQFCLDKDMYLCGVKVESEFGFLAHSDGDVAIHALIDSLLGAIGAGDIGELFPDTKKEYEGIDSKILLKRVVEFIKSVGYEIVNCDITIQAETPKLSPYKQKMRKTLATILGVEPVRVNVKATTTEKLGFVGRKEGVAVEATSMIKIYKWK
jgi:2-C-methyl-D-erythritol 4-phosphate cytidylyltransferase/2-C-methyl-D-erythritol 2,4-cyclodiphosphate synthase